MKKKTSGFSFFKGAQPTNTEKGVTSNAIWQEDPAATPGAKVQQTST